MENINNSLVDVIERESHLLFCSSDEAVKMPSSVEIAEMLGKLSIVVFNDYNSKFGFSKDRLRRLLYDIYLCLAEQSEIAMALTLHPDKLIPNESRVREVAMQFIGRIHELRRMLYTDVEAIKHNDPAASSLHEVISSYPAIKALLHYRTAHMLHSAGIPIIPRIITEIAHSETGIDIHPAAQIGEYFGIDHGTGVVIGETCIIGKHVTLYQGVTLGARNFEYDESGEPMNVARHPIIEDNVTIYSNASVLGRITVGHDSIVGGNVWLTHNVAPYSRIRAGSPIFVKTAGAISLAPASTLFSRYETPIGEPALTRKNSKRRVMNTKENIIKLTGNTPLVKLSRLSADLGCGAEIYAKLESKNPGGSVKDRVALAMIEDAEARGVLSRGGTIIEPTSGNTGIGLAWIGRLKGYDVILTMPDTMTQERRDLLRAYGAKLELTPGALGMKGAIERANELRDSIDGAVVLGQFDNPANPAVHERTTAEEIFRDTDGEIDILVAGVGTGGTVSGTGRGLKKHKPAVEVVAVEPASSAVLSGGTAGPHKIQGIGAGFIPANYDPTVVDRVMTVTDDEAYKTTRLLAETESILAGISSGAALSAAIRLAREPQNRGKRIVVIMPDAADRYLSTGVYAD